MDFLFFVFIQLLEKVSYTLMTILGRCSLLWGFSSSDILSTLICLELHREVIIWTHYTFWACLFHHRILQVGTNSTHHKQMLVGLREISFYDSQVCWIRVLCAKTPRVETAITLLWKLLYYEKKQDSWWFMSNETVLGGWQFMCLTYSTPLYHN